tara:strand:+ start:509 stop:757 length:249 start_codon:yes stop_codon:yes gene_type:complete
MSALTDEALAHLDALLAKDAADAPRLMKINFDVWERRASMVDAWAARGGKGSCPLPPGWTAFDIAIMRGQLAKRRAQIKETA